MITEYSSGCGDWCHDINRHWTDNLRSKVHNDGFRFCFIPHCPGFVNDGESSYPALGFSDLIDILDAEQFKDRCIYMLFDREDEEIIVKCEDNEFVLGIIYDRQGTKLC